MFSPVFIADWCEKDASISRHTVIKIFVINSFPEQKTWITVIDLLQKPPKKKSCYKDFLWSFPSTKVVFLCLTIHHLQTLDLSSPAIVTWNMFRPPKIPTTKPSFPTKMLGGGVRGTEGKHQMYTLHGPQGGIIQVTLGLRSNEVDSPRPWTWQSRRYKIGDTCAGLEGKRFLSNNT